MSHLTTTLKDGSTVAYNLYNPGSSKVPLVMINGMVCCMSDWSEFAEALAVESDRPVLVFDNRNIGFSFGDISAQTLDLMVTDTAELIEFLGFKDVHLLGFSLGGMIALQMLIHHKTTFTIHKLFMCNSACRRPPSSHVDVGSAEGVMSFTRRLFDEEWIAQNKDTYQLIEEGLANTRRPSETMQSQLVSTVGLELSDEVRKQDWTNRLYIVHGKLDALILFEEAEHILQVAKGAQLVQDLPTLDYGHFFSYYFDVQTWSRALERCLAA
ncbi:hypothetical protein E3P99_00688 [Wallemia hederae]|uniref:AB hydrolase-1 domain-containing protein n=1 Tax=Wallemia hederae TaxID=1540922 RepID=A0A4T0FZ89_9BASI|nr:hypothetical protein E3P99_00688 [Wallemia hederae]